MYDDLTQIRIWDSVCSADTEFERDVDLWRAWGRVLRIRRERERGKGRREREKVRVGESERVRVSGPIRKSKTCI